MAFGLGPQVGQILGDGYAGGGVELFSHLQVAATYGWGLSKSSSNDSGVALYGKNRCWTVTAAYLF